MSWFQKYPTYFPHGFPLLKDQKFPFGYPGNCPRKYPGVYIGGFPGVYPRPYPEEESCDGNSENPC